jgi:Fusaric acid resistance protein family
VVTRLARSVGAEWIAQRLMRTNWAALAVTAERRGRRDRAAFAGVMLNRLGLLVQRLAVIPSSDLRDVDSFSQFRVGLSIIDLCRGRHGLAPRTLSAMDGMLDQLAIACRRHVGSPMPPELLMHIDAALVQAMNEPGHDGREDALIGLVGIRRGLFPDAPAYQPGTSISRNLVA